MIAEIMYYFTRGTQDDTTAICGLNAHPSVQG